MPSLWSKALFPDLPESHQVPLLQATLSLGQRAARAAWKPSQMSLTPKQLEAATEYIRILDGVARRLVLEGKAHVENGKLIIHKEQEEQT